MEILNKLGKKASEAYKVTADKTGKLAKEAKLRMKIADLKSQISDIYKEIGKKVYENHVREEKVDLEKELEEFINKASYIITHGGVGSITEALKQNKKIIAVPRKKEYKEHVNNHQMQIVENFNKQGYKIGIQDIEELEKAIKIIPNFKPNKYKTNTQNIIKIIENFIG